MLKMGKQSQGGRVRLADIDKMLKKEFQINYKNLNGVHYLLISLGISWISSS